MSAALPSLADCHTHLFPLIAAHGGDSAYEQDASGLARLEAILRLSDSSDVMAAAASVFCAVVGQRPFVRGNDALAVALLATIFQRNHRGFAVPSREHVHEQLRWIFPALVWSDEEMTLLTPAQCFLYTLTKIFSDPVQKGRLTILQERTAVQHLLQAYSSVLAQA